jgi:hypothetical protein
MESNARVVQYGIGMSAGSQFMHGVRFAACHTIHERHATLSSAGGERRSTGPARYAEPIGMCP